MSEVLKRLNRGYVLFGSCTLVNGNVVYKMESRSTGVTVEVGTDGRCVKIKRA